MHVYALARTDPAPYTCVSMWARVGVWQRGCVLLYIGVGIYVCAIVCVWVRVRLSVCVRVCAHTCVGLCACTPMIVYAHALACVHMRQCAHMCVCACVRAPVCAHGVCTWVLLFDLLGWSLLLIYTCARPHFCVNMCAYTFVSICSWTAVHLSVHYLQSLAHSCACACILLCTFYMIVCSLC